MQKVVSLNYAPGLANLHNIVQGDDAALTVEVKYSDGSPFALDNVSIRIQIRRADKSLLATFTVGSGIEVSGNTFTWTIPDAITSLMDPCQSYNYDVEFDEAGKIRTVLSGKITLMEQVTKP